MKIRKIGRACVVTATLFLLAISGLKMAKSEENTSSSATKQENETFEWGQEVEGFRLSLCTDKKQYALGKAITSRIALKNTGPKDILIGDYSGVGLTYRLEIIRPDGTVAPLTSKGEKTKKAKKVAQDRSLGSPTYQIQPGKSHKLTLEGTNLYYDMSQLGEYSLQVSRKLPVGEDAEKWINIYSNVVKITVGEPEETTGDDSAATIEDEPEK